MKKLLILVYCLLSIESQAQEMNCKAIVLFDQVQGVDAKVFKTLEQGIADFVNTRKWTNDAFDPKEKIECVYTLVVSKVIEGVEGGFTGRLSIQASRPVYNTTYSSNLVNFVDKDIAFKYIQFQPLDFNDNVISGPEPLISNLTATIAFYNYIILGLDYDSFSLKGGTEFFNKALNIANNAPEHKNISGWKAGENQKNRFWIIDQILNPRFAGMRDAVYSYHRKGMDMMYEDPELARTNITNLIAPMLQIAMENPGSIWIQFFFNAKNEEFVNVLQPLAIADRQKYVPMLSQIDVSNAGKYAALLKD